VDTILRNINTLPRRHPFDWQLITRTRLIWNDVSQLISSISNRKCMDMFRSWPLKTIQKWIMLAYLLDWLINSLVHLFIYLLIHSSHTDLFKTNPTVTDTRLYARYKFIYLNLLIGWLICSLHSFSRIIAVSCGQPYMPISWKRITSHLIAVFFIRNRVT